MTRVRQRGIWAPVLCYHSINDNPNIECDPLSVTKFEQHLRFLKENYNVIGVEELIEGVFGGKVLPDRPVAITFDDGYADNFTNAYPLLKKFSIPAIFYVVTNFVSQKIQLIPSFGWGAITWRQLNYMINDGNGLISVGAHTRNHCIVSNLSLDKLSDEICGSRDDIINQTNIRPSTFAFPNGQAADISKLAVQTIKTAGFKAAFSTIWSTKHSGNSKWSMSRVMVSSHDTVEILEKKLSGEYDYIFYWHKIKPLFNRFNN